MSLKPKALVIDGNSMFYRMYYATLNQVEYALKMNYVPNNAIKLMLNNVIKLLQEDQYKYCLIAFDSREKTFRHELMDSYKDNRSKTPDELYKQMVDCIEALEALGICTKAIAKIEADDIVGSFAKCMTTQEIETNIYTSDKDLLQIVNHFCNVNLLKTGISLTEQYTFNNFKEKFFGLEPQQVIDYKAIIGDSSDCLPGVKGIGPKTGIELILNYGSIEKIYDNLDQLSKSVQEKFINSKDIAFKCKKMATILTDVLDNEGLDTFAIKPIDHEKVNKILNKYKLSTIETKIKPINSLSQIKE